MDQEESITEITKVDNNSIRVVKEVVTTQEHTLSYDDLIKRKEEIQAQKEREMTQRDLELEEIAQLLAKCEEFGIVI